MKKSILNIISIILLVFYLAGFCGMHLLKHSCNSCKHSDIELAGNSCSQVGDHNCSCIDHEHAKKSSDQDISAKEDSICCDYELIYLKNNPKTTITKRSKAPQTNESILFIYQSFKLLALFTESVNTPQTAYHFRYQTETSPDMLCTYRC